ncbi:MAG: Na+/H+ antiporter subunit E [Candidatus Bipolaricaulota bacterium]
MLAALLVAAMALVLYLLLTFGSGTIGAWSVEEWIAGAVLSILAGWIGSRVLRKRPNGGWMARLGRAPVRAAQFLVYLLGPFLWALMKANLDVALRVITGKIRPGIVRISPGLATDAERTLLANSITLTPGTLTVDVDDASGDFFVHWIYVTDPKPAVEDVCGSFARWARRIAG